MGFGHNDTVYDNSLGFENGLTGVKVAIDNYGVRAKTVIAPHVFGPQITGMPPSESLVGILRGLQTAHLNE